MHREREKAISILSTVANIVQEMPDPKEIFSQDVLARLQNDLSASCVMLSTNNIFTRIPEKCGPEDSALQEKVKQVTDAGVSSTQIIDAIPHIPFFSRKYLVTAVPLRQNGVQGSIGAVISLQSVYDQVSQGRNIAYIYLLVNTIILTTIGLFRFIHVVVRPIEHLVTLTDAYQNDKDSPFLPDQEGNEFGQLSISLNRMLHRIDDDRQKLRETVDSLENANQQLRATQQKMVQTEKMAAIGRLAAGLAHEIGNPIGIVQGYLELLGQSGLSKDEQQQFSSRSMQELERINRLIHQLLNFAIGFIAGIKAFTAAVLGGIGSIPGGPNIPIIDAIFIILPPPLFSIKSAISRKISIDPAAFIRMDSAKFSIGSSYVFIGLATALFTNTSNLPNSISILSLKCNTDS